MLLLILGTIFSIVGFIGYYANITTLLIIAFSYIIIETAIELIKGTLNNINTLVLASIVGFIIALIFNLPIFNTIAVSLCYETTIMTILSIVLKLLVK